MDELDVDQTLSHIRSLNETNQFKSSEFFASLFISENESVDYRILIEYADALFGLKEYKRAINSYIRAHNDIKNMDGFQEEMDPKYGQNQVILKIAGCYMNMRSNKLALDLYKKVPAKEHTLESLMNLAKIATYFESKKTAMGYYSEVLKKNRYCMEASFNMIELYASLNEILPSTSSRSSSSRDPLYKWYSNIITDAYHTFHGKEFTPSPIYESVSSKNLHIVKMEAMYELKVGNYEAAELILRDILDVDKDWIDGMDAYAFLLERKGSLRELVSLAHSLIKNNPNRSETWIAVGLAYHLTKGKEQALQHLSRALSLNPRSLIAYTIRGDLLYSLGRYSMAIQSYKYAWAIQKTVFVGERLVRAHVKGDLTSAISVGKDVYKSLIEHSKVYATVILGNALSADKKQIKEAVKQYKSALETDPNCIEAILGLSQVLPFEEAKTLLEEYIESHTDFRLNYCLGCLLMNAEETLHEALLHLENANRMNGYHEDTIQAIREVERRLSPVDEEEEEEMIQ